MAERNPHTITPPEVGGNPIDDNVDVIESGTEWWDEEEEGTAGLLTAPNAARITRWPMLPGSTTTTANLPKPTTRTSSRKLDKRYSVQKPMRLKSKGRQRKQNAQAGIKVITNFSNPRGHRASPQPATMSQDRPQLGCFVDLAALQALNGEPPQSSGGFWGLKKAKEPAHVTNTQPSTLEGSTQTSTSRETDEVGTPARARAKPKGLIPSPLNLRDDLSPSDRPIVIGISIPSASLVKHTNSPLTASSYTSKISQMEERRTPLGYGPETPTIIITPAQEGLAWSPLGYGGSHGKHASSVYSQPQHDAFGIYHSEDAPPVPQVPASVLKSENERIAAQRSYFSPDSDQGTSWGDDGTKPGDPSRSRITSTCTVFEDDESPVLARSGRPRSISVKSKDDKHASMRTVGTRRSNGWWNVIVTPFLTRSNTVAARGVFEDQQPPAIPSLAVASAKAAEAERDRKPWEKQFSPITPSTATTISSEPWWDTFEDKGESTNRESSGLAPIAPTARHIAQPSSGTIPFILSDAPSPRIERGLASSPATNNVERPQSFSMPRVPPATATTPESRPDWEISDLPNASTRAASQNINPFVQPRLAGLNGVPPNTQPIAPSVMTSALANQAVVEPSPPPPYSPAPRRYRAILPPGNPTAPENAQSPRSLASRGPVPPGLMATMSSGGSIPLSNNVPIAHVARTPINLNSGYPELPPRGVVAGGFEPPPRKAQKAEAKRQRYEKEDAIARKTGGLWRGRGCIPNKGCYGRRGLEGRKKRRLYLGLTAGFLFMMILIIVLATTLHRKSNTIIEPSQWLNITGFPPIYTGLSVVAAPVNVLANSGCVVPANQWSCDLPKEQQASIAPSEPNQPKILVQIQWDNSSSANATFANVTGDPNLVTRRLVSNPASAGYVIKHLLLKAREIVTFAPNPAPPSFTEEILLGSTTDGIVSTDKAGEPTPFYISFLSSTNSSLAKRELAISPRDDNSSNPFPDVSSVIPDPSFVDGKAAPANLLPLPSQQPVRLYDRGLPSEHYGFYSYFDRSIFLKSITSNNGTTSYTEDDTDDNNGGAKISEAAYRCTWSQTRFLVKMWTRSGPTTRLRNSTSSSTLAPGKNSTQPGLFPYPVTITTDRHGGDPTLKMLYCYSMNDQGGLVATSGQINTEDRGFGGTIINPAPSLFTNSSDPSVGGYDGGTGGCSCKWTNFENVAS